MRNYSLTRSVIQLEVQIDTSLIDETGDVDWQRLDAKAAELVEQVFNSCQLFNSRSLKQCGSKAAASVRQNAGNFGKSVSRR